jgi:type II secretory pathway component PulK
MMQERMKDEGRRMKGRRVPRDRYASISSFILPPSSFDSHRRRGTILIVVLILTVVLTSMTIVLCRAARVELLASANHVSASRAVAVEKAAEQYAIQQIVENDQEVFTLDETYFEAVPVGSNSATPTGYFWLVRPDFGDTNLPLYGLIDESARLNINYATSDMMQQMGMTAELADSIVDWRDTDSETTGSDGAEDDYYAAKPNPYTAKNAPFESIEELLLVKGASPQVLYGQNYGRAGAAQSSSRRGGGISGGSIGGGSVLGDELAMYGLFDYITVYSKSTDTAGGGGQGGGGATGGGGGGGAGGTATVTGKINVLTAPREVLLALPGLDDTDVASLIQARSGQTDTSFVQSTLGSKAAGVMQYITGETKQFSADIVAVSADGRAFKRVRVVIDASNATYPPKIVYRRDITAEGWPLDPGILDSLRTGNGPGTGGLGTVLGAAMR